MYTRNTKLNKHWSVNALGLRSGLATLRHKPALILRYSISSC
jgi:hypothetical protein